MDEEIVEHFFTMESYSATEKEENPSICSNMGKLWELMLNEIMSETERQILYTSLVCGIYKQNQKLKSQANR